MAAKQEEPVNEFESDQTTEVEQVVTIVGRAATRQRVAFAREQVIDESRAQTVSELAALENETLAP